jgi:uncharacterized membrane protein
MEDILHQGFHSLVHYSGWIVWNLFLAFIPLILSFILFRTFVVPKAWSSALPTQSFFGAHKITQPKSLMWWILLAVYGAFLPNAPYVLTDVVHLIEATWATSSVWVITLLYIPVHVGAIALAFEAYVVSLINQSAYLRRIGLKRYIFGVELLTHSLCAIGIYLGRFIRLNSWDLVTSPKNVALATLNDLTGKRPVAVIAITAIILGVLYWLIKQITIGLLLRLRELKHDHHRFD